MPIRLLTSGGGTTTIQPTTSASSVTLTVPSVNANVVTTGDTASVTQAMLGSGLAGTGPAFSAYLLSDQNVSSDVNTKIQCGTEEFDTANCYDSVTNYRFTPTVAGYYQINGVLSCRSASSITRINVQLWKNGSLFKWGGDFLTSGYKVNLNTLVYMNGTTDYLELYGACTAGTAKFTGGDAYNTFFQGFLARAA